MRAVGEEFLGGRRSLGIGAVQANPPALDQFITGAKRAGQRCKLPPDIGIAKNGVGCGRYDRTLNPRAGFCPQRAQVERLGSKQAVLLGFAWRQEFFGPDNIQFAEHILRPDGAVPAIMFALHQFEPGFPAGVVECRVDGTVDGKLIVGIIGIAATETDRLNKAAIRIDFAAHIIPGLLDVETNGFSCHRWVERIADRHAVKAVIAADRKAKIDVARYVRRTSCHFPCSPGAVGQLVLQIGQCGDVGIRARSGLRPQRRRQHVAANLEIARLDVAAVEMDDELVGQGHVDARAARALVGCRTIGCQKIDMNGFIWNLARDAAVNDVDDTANRRRAKEQCRGTTQHFDLVCRQRVDDDRMIDTGV